MAKDEYRNKILTRSLIFLILTYPSTYAHEYGRCLNLKEGTTAEFACPCRTGVGSFSKTNEKGTIWSNGIVAKDKRRRISYQNDKVVIRNVVPDDEGEYTWVCDETYWQKTVCLNVEARPGDVKISAHPSNDPPVGEKLTISVASNSTSRRSFVSCTFSRGQNCSEMNYSQLLYNSSDPAKPSALGQHQRFHVVKRSAVDFDIVFDMVSKEHTGCYVCQEFLMKQQSSDGKKAEVVIRIQTNDWQLTPLTAASASILLALFLIALCGLCICRISKQLKMKGRYRIVGDENKLESLYVISIAASLKPAGQIHQPDLVESAVSQNPQRELEDRLIAMLNNGIKPIHKSEEESKYCI